MLGKSVNHNSGIRPDWPAPENVNAWSTYRSGGYSESPFNQLNLALHVNDNDNLVYRNRALLSESLQLPTQPCWLTQSHSIEVVTADTRQSSIDADGSYTSQSGIVCAVMTADCLPILLCDNKGSVVAAVHAGWRGLLNGIIGIAVKKMATPGHHIMAWLGPAIGPQSFEVQDDVRDAFIHSDLNAKNAFRHMNKNKNASKSVDHSARYWLADLYQLAELQLHQLGIEQIYGKSWCTYKEDSLFFSYRRDGVTGRMASLIWLS